MKQRGPFDYSRSGNPTRKALEDCLAALEGGTHGFAFGTGMAAETTAIALLTAGEHIIVHDDLYGGTYRLMTKVAAQHGVDVQFVNLRDLNALQKAIKTNTKMIWTETPTRSSNEHSRSGGYCRYREIKGRVAVCDNTFLSPYFQNPLALGIDIVLQFRN